MGIRKLVLGVLLFGLAGPLLADGLVQPRQIMVNSLDDPDDSQISFTDSIVTLREAIKLADQNSGASVITFTTSLASSGTITLTRPLPALTTDSTEINGILDSTRKVKIYLPSAGPAAGSNFDFILKISSSNNWVHHLVIGGSGRTGILISPMLTSGTLALHNRITNCHIGYDPFGIISFQNMQLRYGIVNVGGASYTIIGGVVNAGISYRNYIANCFQDGILLSDSRTKYNYIWDNVIGSESESIPGNGNGIHIHSSPANVIGGDQNSMGNIISRNNYVGVLVEGQEAVTNYISHNSFSLNLHLGIDLSAVGGMGDGPNKFINQKTRPGPNMFLPMPVLTSYSYLYLLLSATPHQYTISGTAEPNSKVEVYEASANSSGFGEGKTYITTANVDSNGQFTTSFTFSLPASRLITMLCISSGNTSEFSQTTTFTPVMYPQDVIQLQPWQNLFLLPKGFTRDCGITASQKLDQDLTLNTTLLPSTVASINTAVVIPKNKQFTMFPMTGLSSGLAYLRLTPPDSWHIGTAANILVVVDDVRSLSVDSNRQEISDTLDGATPFKFYRVNCPARSVLNARVNTPNANDPIDPVVYILNRYPRVLAYNNDFKDSTDSYAQLTIPETGDYFIAVGDLYLKKGIDYSYKLDIWLEKAQPDNVTTAFTAVQQIQTQNKPSRKAIGDLNRDGYNDLVVVVPANKTLEIFFKKPGKGSLFNPPVIKSLNFTPGAIAIADFNSDGWKDILVTDATNGAVHVYYNNGGHFNKAEWGKAGADDMAERTFLATGGSTAGVTSDFNLDSYLDYAMMDSSNAILNLFLNDKNGNLVLNQTLPVGSQPVAIASADFNGDNYPELAVADSGTSQIFIISRQTNGQYAVANTLNTVANPSDLKLTDLDHDDRPDILVCSKSTGVLRTYLGMGSNDFQAYQDLPGGTQPTSIALSDINTDGFSDVAVANSGSQDIWIYMGLTLGLLQPVAVISQTGNIEDLMWFSFGNGGAYFGSAPDEGFVKILEGSYRILDFPYSESNDSFTSAFAFANPSASDALIYVSLYNTDGTLIIDPHVTNPVVLTIPSSQQISFFIEDLVGSGVSSYSPWLRVVSLNPEVKGFSLLVSTTSTPSLDGSVAQTEAFPHQVVITPSSVGSDADGQYCIVNPGDASAAMTVTCRDSNGQTLGTPQQANLSANGRWAFDFKTTFSSTSGDCYLDIMADKPVECFQQSGVHDYAATTGLSAPEDNQTQTVLYSPHFADGKVYQSTLDLINTGTAAAHVVVKGLRDDGSTMYTSASLTISAGGLMKGKLTDVLGFDYQSADIISGYLRVESDRSGVVGALTFTDRRNGNFASSLMMQSSGLAQMMFSHLAVGDIGGISYFTGLTILNTGSSAAPVHITVYNHTGQVTGQGDITINPGQKVSQMLPDFVPALTTQAGGYFTVTCSDPNASLCAFELFGDGGLSFMSAVPAQQKQ